MSLFIYLLMAFWSALGLVLRTRLSFIMARALAPTGALFCFVALWSGALWGRPTWGAWWVWDARLTSQLILGFLYLGYLALTALTVDPHRGDRAGALVALVGAINVPIIYFSVSWWSTLHQGASVSLTRAVHGGDHAGRHAVDGAGRVGLHRRRCAARARVMVLEREWPAGWVRDLARREAATRKEPA